MSVTDIASPEAGESVPVNPPRENLVRAVMPGTQVRSSEDGTKTLFGHFARFNEWTEIRSSFEGRFMERIAPGAFSKTIAENRNGMRVLFDHGHDPSIGNKPLGAIRSLEEDDAGAAYEVDLFDAGYVRDLLPALEAGQLGASFRFKVMREDYNKRADASDRNPEGLPERTITEARVMEFGPVTFPAYEGASAGVRSLTDYFAVSDDVVEARIRMRPERFVPVFASLPTDFAPSTDQEPAAATPGPERRDNREKQFTDREEFLSWLTSQP